MAKAHNERPGHQEIAQLNGSYRGYGHCNFVGGLETSFGRGIGLGIVMVMSDFGSVYQLALVSLRSGFPSHLFVGGVISVSMDVGGLGRIGGGEVRSVEVEEDAV